VKRNLNERIEDFCLDNPVIFVIMIIAGALVVGWMLAQVIKLFT
jgi:hypothetical protein